jgi:hypothetical protein
MGAEKLYSEDRAKTMQGFLAGMDVEVVMDQMSRFAEEERKRKEKEAREKGIDPPAEKPGGHSVFMDWYAVGARRHMEKYGTTQRQLAAIAAKNHNNSTLNPLAQYTFPQTIQQVLEDREGHAWIVTYNGLQKFNGYEFETFTSRPGEEGTLSSNFVEDLFEDRAGDLVVVLDDGIDIFHKQSHRFTSLLRDLKFAATRRDEISQISSTAQDRYGSIWVNCNNRLVRIDSVKQEAVVYSDEYLGRFTPDRKGEVLWIINDRSVKHYDIAGSVLTGMDLADIPAQAWFLPVPGITPLSSASFISGHWKPDCCNRD